MQALDPSIVAHIDDLALRARIIVDGALSGIHRSHIRGSSVDFAEHKEYTQGDDIRFLDWRAYAKADRLLIKLYEQEAQLVSHLILDTSSSMGYGNKKGKTSKLDYATSFHAALAYLLSKQRDRIGLYTFGEENPGTFHPPGTRGTSLQTLFALFSEISQKGASGAGSPGALLDQIAKRIRKKRHFVAIASDFFSHDPSSFSILEALSSAGHDVAVFHILDNDEIEFPFHDVTIFQSMESDDELCVNPKRIRNTYHEKLEAFITGIKDRCARVGISYFLINTNTPVEQSLRKFLTRQVKR